MNNRLYSNLIFELSHPGSVGYSLPANEFPHHEIAPRVARAEKADLPEVDEQTVARHYTNHSGNKVGGHTGFSPRGSRPTKYHPKLTPEIAALPAFTNIHPLQPESTVEGWREAQKLMESAFCEIGGFDAFTLKPCAGAHGELTGLMTIKGYQESIGQQQRTKVIVPDSAHGTNPASAAVCGLSVVEVKSLADGTVDVDHLKQVIDELGDTLCAMMMTNPNTLGIVEGRVLEIVELVHNAGGLMYYDGANLNALLGVVRPGDMGFDVMHINTHKTFSTPHGGGGPGSGPVGCKAFLADFLPTVNPYQGNACVWLRALVYVLTLGKENLEMVGKYADLNATYIKCRLKDVYELPIDGLTKHEFVFDGLKDKSTHVTTMDVAKRLLDYGFHAPTIYFPLLFHESLMIEPTETESKKTLDDFIDIMRVIAKEAVETPEVVLNAPTGAPIKRVDDVLAAREPKLIYKG